MIKPIKYQSTKEGKIYLITYSGAVLATVFTWKKAQELIPIYEEFYHADVSLTIISRTEEFISEV